MPFYAIVIIFMIQTMSIMALLGGEAVLVFSLNILLVKIPLRSPFTGGRGLNFWCFNNAWILDSL